MILKVLPQAVVALRPSVLLQLPWLPVMLQTQLQAMLHSRCLLEINAKQEGACTRATLPEATGTGETLK